MSSAHLKAKHKLLADGLIVCALVASGATTCDIQTAF
jgi:hypothetical protein